MDKILRKLFLKWFIASIEKLENKNEYYSLLDEGEKAKFITEMREKIEKNIDEITNQIEDLLEDAMNDIEFDINISLSNRDVENNYGYDVQFKNTEDAVWDVEETSKIGLQI